jgi:parallel beta-helix repeat protein
VKNVYINDTDAGIEIAYSTNSRVTNINVSNNWYGIYLIASSYNIITDNDVYSSNEWGINLSSSSNNRIFRNNIIDNVYQAYDDRGDNIWNETYPIGGNYWSDLDEPSEWAFDEYEGPNQDIPTAEGDGIVDWGFPGGGINPYYIDIDSLDYYPLINSITNNIYLDEGWNLMSIPLIQSDTTLDTVLSSIEDSYDAVRYYDASDKADPWKQTKNAKPSQMNDLNDIDHTMGIWIHINESGGVIFENSGTEPTESQGIQLYKGWNLVGYPSLSNYNRTDGLNNTVFGVHINKIMWYDAVSDSWHSMEESNIFRKGTGYWIHAIEEIVWQVPM